MIAKNGVNWEEWGFTVYGECPEYKGNIRSYCCDKKSKNITFTKPHRFWQRIVAKANGHYDDKNAVLCEEWKEYENYIKWHEQNYYEVEGEKMRLSYRIFDLKNHYISPQTCVFVPEKIAKAMSVYRVNNESDFPNHMYKIRNDRYEVRFLIDGINKVKRFSDYELAFEYCNSMYKKMLSDLADKYYNKIPKSVYERMKNFELR